MKNICRRDSDAPETRKQLPLQTSPGCFAKEYADMEEFLAEHLRVSLAIDAVSDGVWDWDIASGDLTFSPRYYQMLGYAPGEFRWNVEEWKNNLHPDDLQETLRRLERHLASGEVYEAEFRVRTKNGDWLWILDRGSVVERSDEGRPLRMVGTHMDISAFKRLQEEYRKNLSELEDYRRLITAMTDNMLDMLWAKDLEGRFIFTNKATREHLLHCGDTVPIGKTCRYFAERIRGKGLGHILDDLCEYSDRQVLATKRPGRFTEGGMIAGRHMVLEVQKSPLYDRDGNLVGTVGTGRDITVQKQAQEELVRAKEAAEAASLAKNEFLANMSHEIRTPLNGILGMTRLTLETELTEEQRGNLELVMDAGQALLKVLNDILDYSKIEMGKMDLAREPFSLQELIDSSLAMFSVQLSQKNILLRTEVIGNVPACLIGDPGRLRQVLLNLVGNALKFTENGCIEVRAKRLPSGGNGDSRFCEVEFTVTDTGCGVPEDKLDSIFEVFTQADGSLHRQHSGVGLGLAICRRLVRMMGGDIRAESIPGRGSSFRFTARFEIGSRPAASPQALQPAPALPPLRILAAEDNAVNRLFIRRLLEKRGHTVRCAANGDEAVCAAKEERFDCILMDVRMPDMDGVEATVRIRAEQNGKTPPDVPVIALTAHAMKGDREKFLAAGMSGYLSKPLQPVDLEREIGRVCGVPGEDA